MNKTTKIRFWIYMLAICLPVFSMAQGGQSALSITEFSQYLEISKEGTTDFDFGADQDFTIEFWISIPSETTGFGGDPAIISDKDWDSGNNPGFVIFLESGAVRCNIGTGGTRLDIDHDYNMEDDQWHHVALSADRDGDLNLIVDGVIVGSTSMVGFGDITSPNNIYLGQDGVAGYASIKYRMDELRFWNEALSQETIQQNICLKADEADENLIAYYSFDDESFMDIAGDHDLVVPADGPGFATSGAHIGDASVSSYLTDWSDVEVELSSTQFGTALVDNVQGLDGVNIYYVEGEPNDDNGFLSLENQSGYFGVHVAAISEGTANFTYNYDGYAAAEAVAAEENFDMFYRLHSGQQAWTSTGAFHNTDAKTFLVTGTGFSAQLILGQTLDGICPEPYSFELDQIDMISAQLSWGEDGLASEVVYGPAGFTPEDGMLITDLESSSIALEGLSPNTDYDAYVRHACVGLDASAWVGPLSFTTDALPVVSSTGAGSTIDFIGGDDGQNVHMDLGEVAIAENSFTVEMWVNVRDVQGDPAFFSNKDWNSGNNTGLNIFMQGSGAFKVNYKTDESPRVDISSDVSILNAWNHIAVVVNRDENMTLYINGIEVNSGDISTTTGTLASDLPWILGQDGTGNYSYGHQFDGWIDEVRIWNGVRTPEELRQNMCVRLSGTEPGLMNYFPLDNASGIVANDHANELNHATIYNIEEANWVMSAAAIGEESVWSYGEAISDLSLSSAANGTLSATNYDALQGFHIYRIDQAPNHTVGMTALEGEQIQFGVFPVGTGSADVSYDYTGWTEAETATEELALFGRENLDFPYWLNTNASTDEMTLTATISNRTEFLIGVPLTGTCDDPTDLAVEASVYSGLVSWTTGGSANWNLSYGPAGITPEEGTIELFTGDNPYTIAGLEPETSYYVFVQDSCVGIGTSNWVGPIEFTTLEIPAYLNTGAGTALSFDGSQSTSHGTPESLRPETAVTLEAWINPVELTTAWTGVFSYLQDNGSNESGYGLVYNNGKMRMYIMTEGSAGNQWNNGPGAEMELNKWSHIAGTYDGETIKFYLNGILMEEQAATGNIDWEFLPIDFRIGTFYDDNEDVRFNGQIDEVKIWDTALTAEEIRANMCQKMVGDEENLIGYFNLNDGPGSINVTDLSVNANHGVVEGNFDVNANWTISGAHIGDESATMYGSDLMTTPIAISSDMYGELSLIANDENVLGAHVYRVNENPDASEISDLNENASHFGIYVVGSGYVSYAYDYSAYSEAVAEAENLMLFSRNNGATDIWTVAVTENNTDESVLSGETSASQHVYLSTDASTCAFPSGATFGDEEVSSAVLSWDEVEGASYNLIYGPAGAEIQNGTLIEGITESEYLVEGLQANSSFVYYIQTICGDDETSYWVGPVPFNTLQCEAPANINVDEVTSNSVSLTWEGGSASTYLIEWGPAGFTLGFGIQSAANELPLVLEPLAPNTTYEFYVQTVCGEWGESVWMGPYSFTTEDPNGLVEAEAYNTVVYPNPAQDRLTVSSDLVDESAIIQIYDITGKMMIESQTGANEVIEISVIDLESGVYILSIQSDKATQSMRFVKN